MNNKDVSADYDNTAYDITKFFLVSCFVGIIFHYCFSICSCSLCAHGGSRKVVLSSTNKPERLNPQLLFFFCFLFLFSVEYFYSMLIHLFAPCGKKQDLEDTFRADRSSFDVSRHYKSKCTHTHTHTHTHLHTSTHSFLSA